MSLEQPNSLPPVESSASEGKCPYMAKKEEQASTTTTSNEADEGKCPYLAKKKQEEEASSTEGKCPYLAKKKEEEEAAAAAAEGKCPYLAKKKEEEEAKAAATKTSEEGGKCPYSKEREAQQDWSKADSSQLKEHFTQAYNNVATQQDLTSLGDAKIAKILVEYLGYSQQEIDVIGSDVRLMQGTGNPHTLANLQEGETVVDLGSGLGIDAILAGAKVGKTGRVVGIDLSEKEVLNAIKRVNSRSLRNVDFRIGDIENPPFEDNSVNAVISNGGFCLVPDKKKSFQEIFRMLKPGGRFSISCTARKKPLDSNQRWPSCFVVFMPLYEAKEMLEGIGFTGVTIDDANSRMDVWEEEADIKPEVSHSAKVTIHSGGTGSYDHLKGMNMNEFFARVNIAATKPAN